MFARLQYTFGKHLEIEIWPVRIRQMSTRSSIQDSTLATRPLKRKVATTKDDTSKSATKKEKCPSDKRKETRPQGLQNKIINKTPTDVLMVLVFGDGSTDDFQAAQQIVHDSFNKKEISRAGAGGKFFDACVHLKMRTPCLTLAFLFAVGAGCRPPTVRCQLLTAVCFCP